MIAEIYHKISSTGSNLTERLEDELTGNYFGNLRYIPFCRGLGKILGNYVKCNDEEELRHDFLSIDTEEWNTEFWKKSGEGEIDCYMDGIGDIALGIEVKFYSGLSGKNQLKREARMLQEWSEDHNKKILLFTAPKEADCKRVYGDNKKDVEDMGVKLCYLTWVDALEGLEKVVTETVFEELIINDLRELLTLKGFKGFKGFLIPEKTGKINETDCWTFNNKEERTFNFRFSIPEIGDETYGFGK
ncbi:MAG: hypothetical protein Q4B70_19560 [Lachnospiraceae bacterium]|nr:hypothetical protein [Lachnospiraceae bacterium]